MSGNSQFALVSAHDWRGGFGNLMRSQFARWFKTRLWWVQSLMWTGIICGILLTILTNPSAAGDMSAMIMFCLFAGLFTSIAAIIIMQDALVGEKETGTAAWVLSKPVSRSAFYLSKLAPNMVGTLLTMLLIPGIIFCIEMYIFNGEFPNPLNFLGAILVLWVNITFYLALTHMLGAFFNFRAPVIAIPLAVAFGQQMLFGILPSLAKVLPWTLAVPLNNESSIAGDIMSGHVPTDLTPLISTIIMIMIFIIVGLWRFSRQEF